MDFGNIFDNKSVLVTGHTGFIGAWLCEYLLTQNAKVIGYALDPPTTPSLFEVVHLTQRLHEDLRNDVRNRAKIHNAMRKYRPDFVFHLAAQPLVLRSFDEPHATCETNIMGSLNVLEAVRSEHRDCIVLMVTTDKVYEPVESDAGYCEEDRLGGDDPYSASKASAEIIISAFRKSFFWNRQHQFNDPVIAVASVRGGNVIGGGDWAKDRIVPDCVRHLSKGESIPVRNAHATRPWQHVLDFVRGCLDLAAEIFRAREVLRREKNAASLTRYHDLCAPFNFGPVSNCKKSVGELVQSVVRYWPGKWHDVTEFTPKHETIRLSLRIDKAHQLLEWSPKWGFDESVKRTVQWYRQYYDNNDSEIMRELTREQIWTHREELAS